MALLRLGLPNFRLVRYDRDHSRHRIAQRILYVYRLDELNSKVYSCQGLVVFAAFETKS